jgi:ribose transport system substrate-binding protein
LNFAFFAASSQNGFDAAIYQGAKQTANKMLGSNYSMRLFDGQFNATTQYNQVESSATGKQYDGAIIEPNDNVGIAPAVKAAIKSGIKLCTTLFPVGSNMFTLKPQVPGLTCTAAQLPAPGAQKQAQAVVQFCASLNPCTVILLIGQLQFPFDKERFDTWKSVLAKHPNIKVLGYGQGAYDRGTSLKTMTDLLQAHPHFNVLLSNADQQVEGALIAMHAAGWNVKSLIASHKLYIMGGGATQETIADIRNGTVSATLGSVPVTMGALAMKSLILALEHKPYVSALNMDQLAPLPDIITKQILQKHPSFRGQWSG